MITAPALTLTLEGVPPEKLAFATAGGAWYKGAQISGFCLGFGRNPMYEAKSENVKSVLPSETVPLTKFVDAPCAVVSGEVVSRRLLIKYIANKLGGAHYDPKRLPDERVFSLLDSVRERIKILDKPVVYFELLSIGQALAMAPDIERFLSAAA